MAGSFILSSSLCKKLLQSAKFHINGPTPVQFCNFHLARTTYAAAAVRGCHPVKKRFLSWLQQVCFIIIVNSLLSTNSVQSNLVACSIDADCNEAFIDLIIHIFSHFNPSSYNLLLPSLKISILNDFRKSNIVLLTPMCCMLRM